jgi:hypothetical protein
VSSTIFICERFYLLDAVGLLGKPARESAVGTAGPLLVAHLRRSLFFLWVSPRLRVGLTSVAPLALVWGLARFTGAVIAGQNPHPSVSEGWGTPSCLFGFRRTGKREVTLREVSLSQNKIPTLQ